MDVTNILNVPFQKLNVKPGNFLVSEPFMQDPYFKRSVVFVTEHNERGSFGLIINKPLPMYLNEAIENAPAFDARLRLGGPVENETLHYLHVLGDIIPDSIEVMEGVFWGGDFNTIKRMMSSGEIKPTEIRLFIGYAGWGEGQLKSELENKSWIISDADKQLLFNEKPENLWSEVLQKMGAPYSYLVNLPEDPRLN
ncbi:YqgE/AlgH family protein [Bacteroidota bacterium]